MRKRSVKHSLSMCFVFACLIGLPLVLAACGGGEKAAAPPPATTAAAAAPPATTAAAPAATAAAPAATAAAPTAAAAAAPSGEPITIGAAVAQSGFIRPYDWPATIIAGFAVDDINTAGGLLGRPLKLITADMKSDAALGPTAASELIDKGADLGLVTCDFDFGSPAALTFQKKDIVSMSICAGAPQFGPKGIGPLAFSNGIATPNEAAGGAYFAYNGQGWRSTYILEDTTIQYTTTWIDGFQDTWKHLGGEVVLKDTFENPDPSVAAQITRFKALPKEPDFITMCTYSPGGPSAIRQFRAAGIDTPILLCVGMDGNYWFNAVPGLSNTYVTNYGSYVGDDEDPKVNELYNRYKEKTGEAPPQAHFMMGYSAVQLLALGVEKAGTTEGKALAKTMETFNNVQHFLGPTTFTPEFHISFGRPVAITEIQNGEAHFKTRLIPEYVPPPRLPK